MGTIAMERFTENPCYKRFDVVVVGGGITGASIFYDCIINDNAAVSAITPAGRHCFLIPWRGHPDDYRVTCESILELIDEVNGSFEGPKLTVNHVLHTYGGLRPLVESGTKETYKSSRKYEIQDNAAYGIGGLLTVEGGKWTTSRGLAEKVVDRLGEKPGLSISPSVSAGQCLKGSEIRDMNAFLARIKDENRDFAEETIDYLGRIYVNRLIELNETNQTARIQPGMMGPAFETALNRGRLGDCAGVGPGIHLLWRCGGYGHQPGVYHPDRRFQDTGLSGSRHRAETKRPHERLGRDFRHSGGDHHIQKHGGSLSHHHGVGRMMAPWMETHLGKKQMDALKALKNHFGPNHIMNPGGQLGLDLDS